jgi:transposase
LLYDLDRSTVEAISEGHDAQAGIECLQQHAPGKIVHDRFHVMQLATETVDAVGRSERRGLLFLVDKRLSKKRNVWLTSQKNLPESQQQPLATTFTAELKTGKAWSYRELLRDLWNHATTQGASEYFHAWYRRVIHTRLEPMNKVARTNKQRLENVVSDRTHQITNSVAEGLNSRIMSIKRRVGGYRNPHNFETAIFFHCGGLDLYPR